jgi:predicted acylesterase/phospholipase RssA
MKNEAEKDIGVWVTGGGTTTGRQVLGMWEVLEELGVMERVGVIGAVSIGSYMSTGIAWGVPPKEVSKRSLQWTAACSATPNLRTKDGFFDPQVALDDIKDQILDGKDPRLNEGKYPYVIGASRWEDLEPIYYDGEHPLLDALRKSISNPFYFNLVRENGSHIGDGGVATSVGVNYLRENYGVTKTILLDVQSRHKWIPPHSVDEPIAPWQKIPIQLVEAATKAPFLGEWLKNHTIPQAISALVHARHTAPILFRAPDALLTQIVDLQIEIQKPDVVIRAEDVMTVRRLHNREIFHPEVARQLIQSGREAALLREEQLRALLWNKGPSFTE